MVKKTQDLDARLSVESPEQGTFQPISGQDSEVISAEASPTADQPTAVTVEAASGTVESSGNVGQARTGLPDLDEFLRGLTADQLQRVKAKIEADSIVPRRLQSNALKNADGSLDVLIHIDPVIVEQLELWSDGEGLTLAEEAQNRINEAISGYVFGDWSSAVVKPAEPQPVAK